MKRNWNRKLGPIGRQARRELASEDRTNRFGQDFARRVLQAQDNFAVNGIVRAQSHDGIEREGIG
jgi:hypothetical protein